MPKKYPEEIKKEVVISYRNGAPMSGIISNASCSKRLEILADIHAKFDRYSVGKLCEALDIAKGTIYNHIFRYGQGRNLSPRHL